MLKKPVQQGRRRVETGGVPSGGYVEDFDESRTTLADFFSNLLGGGRELLRQQGHVFLLKGEMDDQEDDPHADRRVGDIESRPMVGAHIDIEKIDHLAIP
jgi:hypothetical protein